MGVVYWEGQGAELGMQFSRQPLGEQALKLTVSVALLQQSGLSYIRVLKGRPPAGVVQVSQV